MLKLLRSALITAAALSCTSSSGRADLITVVDAGFEGLSGPANSTHFDASGRLRIGHFSGITALGNPNEYVTPDPIPGWTVTGNDVGINYSTTAAFPTVPDGQNTAYIGGSIGGGTISQTLSAKLAAGTYTLMVDVGNPGAPSPLTFAGYVIQLLAGNTVLAQDSNSVSPAPTAFSTATLTFTAAASNLALGQNLTIRLLAINPGAYYQTDFDNVRLNFAPAPEPASVALLGIGLVGTVAAAKLHRKPSGCR